MTVATWEKRKWKRFCWHLSLFHSSVPGHTERQVIPLTRNTEHSGRGGQGHGDVFCSPSGTLHTTSDGLHQNQTKQWVCLLWLKEKKKSKHLTRNTFQRENFKETLFTALGIVEFYVVLFNFRGTANEAETRESTRLFGTVSINFLFLNTMTCQDHKKNGKNQFEQHQFSFYFYFLLVVGHFILSVI